MNSADQDIDGTIEQALFKPLTLDVDLYQNFLDETELSEDQKREILQAVWIVLVGFIDLGFKIAPQNTCGQVGDSGDDGVVALSGVVRYLSNPVTEAFTAANQMPTA